MGMTPSGFAQRNPVWERDVFSSRAKLPPLAAPSVSRCRQAAPARVLGNLPTAPRKLGYTTASAPPTFPEGPHTHTPRTVPSRTQLRSLEMRTSPLVSHPSGGGKGGTKSTVRLSLHAVTLPAPERADPEPLSERWSSTP
ncbi:uncharacterized protein LOC100602793 [Nomascus leucogenys]|uniref:uncharacterized protein LOC100602793 n=1 Tax=Nomascus leucogenys TaxID=61853 RepID=UPI00122DB290|nr:uncharacterized protein LOC100602793 [Nomascus leucogenys]